MVTNSPRHGFFAIVLVLGLAIWLVFGQTVLSGFTNWDDDKLIHANPLVNPPTLKAMLQSWKGSDQGLFIPVVYNVWSGLSAVGRWSGIGLSQDDIKLQRSANGIPAWPFHVANVLVHFVNAVLVLLILSRYLRFPMTASLVGALLFALHPLQTEVVAWATGMKDLLSCGMALGGIAAYLEGATAWNAAQRTRGHLFYSASLLLFFIGSLAKPGIVGAPLIAAILDMAFITTSRVALLRAIAPVLVIMPSALLTSLVQSPHYGFGIGPLQRLQIALHATGFYIWKSFVPSQLCIDYGLKPLVVIVEPGHVPMMLVPLLYLVALLVLQKWRRELLVVGAIFFVGVAPVLGLTPFYFQNYSTVADRYIYLSMFGLAVGLAYAFAGAKRPPFRVALAAGLIGLAAMTYAQAQRWHSSFSIMRYTTQVNPRAFAAYNNMASSFIAMINVMPGAVTTRASTRAAFAADDPLVPLAKDLLQYQLSVNPVPGPAIKNLIWLDEKAGRHAEALGLALAGYRMAALFEVDPEVNVADQFEMASLYELVGDRQDATRWLCYGLLRNPGEPHCVQAIAALVEERKAASQPATRSDQRSQKLDVGSHQ